MELKISNKIGYTILTLLIIVLLTIIPATIKLYQNHWLLDADYTADQICKLMGFNESGSIGIDFNPTRLTYIDCWHTEIDYLMDGEPFVNRTKGKNIVDTKYHYT